MSTEQRGSSVFTRITRIPNRLQMLEDKVSLLQQVVDFISGGPLNAWLYANRAERMDANLPFFDVSRRRFHLQRYDFARSYVVGKCVADIACGTGYGVDLLKKKGNAAQVFGVDIDQKAVDYATEKYGGDSVRYVCAAGNATGLPDQAFDVITSFETIEHIPDDSSLMREFHRLLKPNGFLICSTPNSWPLSIAPYHVREYDRTAFIGILSNLFEVEGLYNQNSGSEWQFNHGQPFGIVPTTESNYAMAECFIAVCKKT